jgi:hypothetical protein
MRSSEYERSLEETAYLLRSPRNARRLLEAIADLERAPLPRHLFPDPIGGVEDEGAAEGE